MPSVLNPQPHESAGWAASAGACVIVVVYVKVCWHVIKSYKSTHEGIQKNAPTKACAPPALYGLTLHEGSNCSAQEMLDASSCNIATHWMCAAKHSWTLEACSCK